MTLIYEVTWIIIKVTVGKKMVFSLNSAGSTRYPRRKKKKLSWVLPCTVYKKIILNISQINVNGKITELWGRKKHKYLNDLGIAKDFFSKTEEVLTINKIIGKKTKLLKNSVFPKTSLRKKQVIEWEKIVAICVRVCVCVVSLLDYIYIHIYIFKIQ